MLSITSANVDAAYIAKAIIVLPCPAADAMYFPGNTVTSQYLSTQFSGTTGASGAPLSSLFFLSVFWSNDSLAFFSFMRFAQRYA